VVTALEIKFDSANVTRGNKAIKVGSDDTVLPLDADIVACQDHRKYHSYPANGDPDLDTGIYFKSQTQSREIINYPLLHYENGKNKNKNQNINGNYKETIRMFKNARNKMRERFLISSDEAPSYYIECLLFNVPDQEFKYSNLRTRYDSIVTHLEEADLGDFDEQCEMFPLFDSFNQDRWTEWRGDRFVNGLRDLWEDW
jgi:hypothetical protein